VGFGDRSTEGVLLGANLGRALVTNVDLFSQRRGPLPKLLLADLLLHPVLKNCAKLFLSEFCQISTNFDNYWHKDGKEAKIMRAALIFRLI